MASEYDLEVWEKHSFMFPFDDPVSWNNLWTKEALLKTLHSEVQKGEMASAIQNINFLLEG